ncbi:SGM_5486 family transporter-associated protein [Streptomyces sp. NPDC088116]
MPVLEPNPQNGQQKLLLLFGTIIGILVIIGVIASVVSP